MKKITLLFSMLLIFALKGQAQFPAPYCAVNFTNNVEPITLVQFAGINNTTIATIGAANSPALENFTAIVGNVGQGITYPISVKGNTDGNFTTYVRAFIDWNQDGDFADASESYDLGTIVNSTGVDAITLTSSIAVPPTASVGNTRMRIIKRFNTNPDSCNTINTGWGQAEDYTLAVAAGTCTPPTVTFAAVSNCPAANFNVTVNVGTMGSAATYQVTDNQQSPTQTISAAGTLTFGPYASGTPIVITVTDPNASLCNVTSATLNNVCLPGCASNPSPANGSTTVPAGPVTLTWDVPTTGGTPASYNVYAGNAAGALTLVGNYTTNSTGNNLVINNYSATIFWQVIAVNAAGSATGCAEWSFTTIAPPGYCLNTPAGLFPAATFTPATCDGVTENEIVANAYAGEYSNVNLTSGQTYIFKSGTTDFVTIANAAGDAPLAYGPSPLTWVSNVTGVVRFISHTNDQCGTANVNRVRSIICGTVTTDAPDYVNLQWPPNATIPEGGTFDVFGQVYEPGVTEPAGQGAGITAWVGISTTDSNPNTWTTWIPMTFNANATNPGNNDEYTATIGDDLDAGSYFYATRFRLNTGPYVYGGIDASNNGGIWDGTTYGSGELTVTPPPAPANDDCSGATVLTVDAAFCNGTNTNGTNLGATDSGVAEADCFNYGLNDVWFTFTAPDDAATVDISTDFLGGTLWDTEIALYSGTCGTLTELDCDQDGGTTTLENGFSWNSVILDTPVTAGETYFIRVSGYSEDNFGNFCLEVSKNQLSVDQHSLAGIKVSPNPVRDVLNISGEANVQSATVRNLLGQQLLVKDVTSDKNINMSTLPSGTYLVELSSETGKRTVKVIKE
ncbi:T9SS type A sorting domain-containing protein [Flavobacterium sp.]|uniref:T9SS type A sorting domain-containing protein n=1 Tax=Flavobacterium sp. TaxID=239 RepID=UPI0012063F53|nr:T9SS type A sorting domain-containing protein [Flavobacterium sp.]RZJ70205.1 MAG: T9SS type A sorting domain-containing protein [Flavobacterium sp.]